jgi:phospho-N-acetylmuramoyl-pentapeptide-transferase
MADIVRIIIPSILTCIIGILITPVLSTFLYKHKMWKKKSVTVTTDGHSASITSKLHNDEERRTPRMGGVVIWGSVLIVISIIIILAYFFDSTFTALSYFSRAQTWIPLCVFIGTALFGLVDDYFVCMDKGTYVGGGLSLQTRLLFVFCVSLFVGLWIYIKLDYTSIHLFFNKTLILGLWIVPVVVLVLLALYSGGIIDGIDGLSGGVFASMFSAYGVIAFAHGQIDLAALCMSIVGGILAFLWFNIPPARFFLSETGSMSLTITLGVIAFLTQEVFVLGIIALPLLVTSLSTIIQMLSKKFRNGKKVFVIAPLHNHFQAIGWPPYKVTMRYWIVSIFCSITGVIIALL